MDRWNEVFKHFLNGKGLVLRLTTFAWGVSCATMSSSLLGGNAFTFLIFLTSAVLCHILTWNILKDIYYISAAEEMVRQNMLTETDDPKLPKKFAKKSARRSVCFAKTCSLLGSAIAGLVSLPLLCPEKTANFNNVSEMMIGGLVTTILVAWIPFVLIMLGKLIMKSSAKSHKLKVERIVREMETFEAGDTKGMISIKENNLGHVRFLRGLGITICVICGGPYLFGLLSLLPQPQSNPTAVVEQSESQYEESISETEAASSATNSEINNTTETEDDWYNNPNSNGYNFQISEDCLNAYLAYVQSNDSKEDFKKFQESKRSVEDGTPGYNDSVLSYFAIAGRHTDEPFLILASRNDNLVSDELTFCVYGSGNTVYPVDYFERDYDMMSFAETMVVNNIYVFCEERKDKADFYEETVVDGNTDTVITNMHSENYLWIYKTHPDDGSPVVEVEWDGKTSNVIPNKVENRELAPIKWFSLDEIEEARAYFSQFTGAQAPVAFEDSADRSLAYQDTILQYMPYFESGSFHIDGDRYLFTSISEDDKSAFMNHNMNAIVEFDGGSASSATRYIDIIPVGDSYKILKRGLLVGIDDYGSFLEIEVSELTEQQAIDAYNAIHSSEPVTSLTELIQRESN